VELCVSSFLSCVQTPASTVTCRRSISHSEPSWHVVYSFWIRTVWVWVRTHTFMSVSIHILFVHTCNFFPSYFSLVGTVQNISEKSTHFFNCIMISSDVIWHTRLRYDSSIWVTNSWKIANGSKNIYLFME